jgi:hypothetical protein
VASGRWTPTRSRMRSRLYRNSSSCSTLRVVW